MSHLMYSKAPNSVGFGLKTLTKMVDKNLKYKID